MESPGSAAEVVTVPDVVADDADPVHVILGGQGAIEHDPVTVTETALVAGSSWKSLPVPLKSFDCLAAIPHAKLPGVHPSALRVKVVLCVGPRFRLRNSPEPVMWKPEPEGAETFTEPSVWVDASFLIVNIKEVFTPAVTLDGEATAAKHLPDGGAQDVCPAAGAANIATPSMLAASTKKETRVTMKPAFGMVTPSLVSTEPHERASRTPLCRDPLCIRTYPLGNRGTALSCVHSVIRLALVQR
jgi:hypothetical protein